jgi:hypothetical protein
LSKEGEYLRLILLVTLTYYFINRKLIAHQEKLFEDFQNSNFTESPRKFDETKVLNEERFWELIDMSKREYPNNFDSQMEYLTKILSDLSNEEIIDFEKILREKMIELWNYNVKSLYQIIYGNYLSTDGFIYFRFWLVSNGKDFFNKSIYETDNLSEEIFKTEDGEMLLIVADNAFKIKNMNKKIDKLPRDVSLDVDYDFGNYKMTGRYISPANFKKHFPKLTRKF